jgi:hypothetical protein
MALSCKDEQAIENLEKRLGMTILISKVFSLRPPDFPLRRILVKVVKQRVEVRTKVQLMKTVIVSAQVE